MLMNERCVLEARRRHGSPYQPGGGRARLWQSRPLLAMGGGRNAPAAGARRSEAPLLARREYHDHLAALEARLLLDFGDLRRIAFHPVEQLVAEILVGHFPAAKPQRDLNLVAFFEEPLD